MRLYSISGSGKYKSDNKQFTFTGYAIINEVPISGTPGQPGVKFDIVNFSISAATDSQVSTFIRRTGAPTGDSYILMDTHDDYLRLNGELGWNKWHFDQQRLPPFQLTDTMVYGNDVMTLEPSNIIINNLTLNMLAGPPHLHPPTGLRVSDSNK